MKDIFNKPTEQKTISPALDMENMSDEEIKQAIATGYKLLNRRKRQHQKQVQVQIKKLATDAGINVSFSNKSARKAQALKSG